jgi:opacity protein-like surface antigen
MLKIGALFGLLLVVVTIPAVAQGVGPIEASAGYTLRVYTQPDYSHSALNGWYASADYNILHRIGAAGEITGTYKDLGTNGNLSVYSAMVGPQIYPFAHNHKITPFGHVLFGVGFYRISYPAFGGFPATVTTDTNFSWQAGGGVDMTRTKHWAIRLIELDYGSTNFPANRSHSTYRASVGFVYHFDKK